MIKGIIGPIQPDDLLYPVRHPLIIVFESQLSRSYKYLFRLRSGLVDAATVRSLPEHRLLALEAEPARK